MPSVNGSLQRLIMPAESRRHHRRGSRHPSNHITMIHKLILLVVFLYLGISTGIPGATLIYIEKLTSSREDEVALIFSSRAVGSLAGWLLGLLSLDLDNFEPTTLMSLGTFGLFITHLILPWAVQLWWVFCGFTFQGALMAITVQGCLAYVRKLHPKNAVVSQQLVFICLFGCVICPFIVLPFFKDASILPEHHGLTTFMDRHSLSSVSNLGDAKGKSSSQINTLRRERRSIHISSGQPPPTGINTSSARHSKPETVNITRARPLSSILEKEQPSLPTKRLKVAASNRTLNITTNNNSGNKITSKNGTISSNNNNTNIKTTNTTSTRAPIGSTTPVPKKPLVIDAKELKQDPSSADGRNTAVQLKQLGEVRRLEKVAGPPEVPVEPPAAPVAGAPPTSTPKPVQPVNTTKSVKVSTLGQFNHSAVPNPNKTITQFPSSLPKNQSLSNVSVLLTTLLRPAANRSVSTTPSPRGQPSIKKEIQLPKTVAEKITATTTRRTVPFSTPYSVRSRKTTPAPIISTTSVVSTTPHQHHRIVEHATTSHFAERFLFTRPLQPIQRVYCLLSALGLLTWLLTLTLTGWCRGLRCSRRPNQTNEQPLSMRTMPRRSSSHGEDTRPLFSQGDDLDEQVYDRWLPTSVSAPGSITSNLRSSLDNSDNDEDSLYVSAQEYALTRSADPERGEPARPGKAVRQSPVSRMQYAPVPPSPNGAAATTVARWPQISWPVDAWLLLAEFFSTGLETAFGGFVHGFTVRYLLWSPSLGFLANSLFWLGGLVGRLPCLLLIRFRSTRLLPARTSSPVRGSNSPRSSVSFASLIPWRITLLRIGGGLVCIFSSISLTRFSLSSDGCAVPTFSSNENASPVYLSWLAGSLFMGLGLGVASSTMGLVGVDCSDNREMVHRIQLAGVLGQLLIPATVGYVHHLAVLWRYACVLSSTALILSALITLVLTVDLIGRRYSSTRHSPQRNGAESNRDPEPVDSTPMKPAQSPVALHAVSE